MPFTITITETKPTTKKVGHEWEVIAQKQEISERSHDRDVLVPQYGYTPLIEKTVDVTTEILKQTVEELDVVEVLKAVNKITT